MENITATLKDINASDRVFKMESGNVVKVRVLDVTPSAKEDPNAARLQIHLKISGSLCDENGKALTDSRTDYQIAPEHLASVMVDNFVRGGGVLREWADEQIAECADATDRFASVVAARSQYVRQVAL